MTYKEVLKKVAAIAGHPQGWSSLKSDPAQQNIRLQQMGMKFNKNPLMQYNKKQLKNWRIMQGTPYYQNVAGDAYDQQSPQMQWQIQQQDPLGIKREQQRIAQQQAAQQESQGLA